MRYFFKYTNNDSSEIKAQKFEIIKHVIEWPISLSFIESELNHDGLGKRASRDLAKITISTLWIALGIQIVVFICSAYDRRIAYFSLFSYPLYFLFLLIFKTTITRGWGHGNNTPESLAKYLCDEITILNWRQKTRINFLLNSPFSLRTVWFWSFIFSISIVLLQDKYKLVLGQSYDSRLFNELIIDLFKGLIIAIVSYIATNIISELLDLRNSYATSNKQLVSLKQNLDSFQDTFKNLETKVTTSTKEIETINESLSHAISNVSIITGSKELSSSLSKLKTSLSIAQDPLFIEDSFKQFNSTFNDLLRIFTEKASSDGFINFWLLNSVNEYYKQTSTEFNNNTTLITKFQCFGQILDSTLKPILETPKLISEFKRKYSIHTILVLPPARILNFNKGVRLDEKWRAFLKINRDFCLNEIEFYRHFISIDFNGNEDKIVKIYFGEEATNLKNDEVKMQLEEKYLVKKEYVDASGDLKGKFELLTDKHNSDGETFEHYPKSSEHPNSLSSIPLTLRKIIESIHYNKSANVIELKLPKLTGIREDDLKLLDNIDDILWDKNSHRALDYFAIRDKVQNKWIFCFKTIYDDTLDLASVSINFDMKNMLNNKSSGDIDTMEIKWSDLCSKLDSIFISDRVADNTGVINNEKLKIKIYPIDKY